MAAWLPAYGIGAVVAFSAHSDNQPHATDWLFVPLVGPWLTLAAFRNHSPCVDGGSEPGLGCGELLIVDGMLQAAGAALTTVALALPRDRASGRTSMMITPYARQGGVGVLMAGAF
jgi:hypothetical protein